ncbi:MAG: aldo/keto reductase [Oscillospiraceae bacterium]|nr:aldo/keto reductase [Oscillospiraceae bacterium]
MKYYINNSKIPPVAIGTWAWGSGMNGSKMIFGTSSDESTIKEAFAAAYKNGFNLIDTSAVYGMGNAERILGDCIKNKSIILSDKYTPSTKFDPKSIEDMLAASTSRLHGKIPDIYWLHMPVNLEKNIEHMCRLLKQKKIGSIGVSNCSMEQILKAQEIINRFGFKLAGVQNHYSLLYRSSEKSGITRWCQENSVPFFAYMVLEQGALTGRFDGEHGFPFFSRRGFAFPKRKLRRIEPLLVKLKNIGESHGISTAQTAIAWAIAKGTVPLIGVTKPYQAKSLVKLDTIILSESETAVLDSTAEATGIEVPGIWEKRG